MPLPSLQDAFDLLVSAIQEGVDQKLWKESDCAKNPGATPAEVASLQSDLGIHNLKEVSELLRLSNGFSFTARVKKNDDDDEEWITLAWGGTGPSSDEGSIRHAFGYTGEEGKRHFRKQREVPLYMVDYDMCVIVYRTRTGFVICDDREKNKQKTEGVSLADYIQKTTKKLRRILKANAAGTENQEDDDEEESSSEDDDDDDDDDDEDYGA